MMVFERFVSAYSVYSVLMDMGGFVKRMYQSGK